MQVIPAEVFVNVLVVAFKVGFFLVLFYVSQVFFYSGFERPFCFTYILEFAYITGDEIDYVSGLAVEIGVGEYGEMFTINC